MLNTALHVIGELCDYPIKQSENELHCEKNK